jgi:hypothetical protein
VKDTAGNAAAAGDGGTFAVAVADDVAPAPVATNPVSVSDPLESFRTFSTVYRDADGAADMDLVYLRVRSVSGDCLTALYRALENKLYLIGGDGKTLLGGFAPGSVNTISTGLGTLDCEATVVTRNGDSLIVDWRVAASSPMAGTNSVQLFCRDRSRIWSSVATAGTWTLVA